jgi:hypothetical protein
LKRDQEQIVEEVQFNRPEDNDAGLAGVSIIRPAVNMDVDHIQADPKLAFGGHFIGNWRGQFGGHGGYVQFGQ